MVARRSLLAVTLIPLLMLTVGTAARQADTSATPETLWQFEAGG